MGPRNKKEVKYRDTKGHETNNSPDDAQGPS